MVRRPDLAEFNRPPERVQMQSDASTFQQFAQAGRGAGFYRSYQGTRQYDQLQIRNLTLRDSMGARLVDALILGSVPGSGVVFRWPGDYAQKVWDNWHWNSIQGIADVISLQRYLVKGMVRDGESFATARMGRERQLFLDFRSPSTIRTDSGIWDHHNGYWKQGGILFGTDLVPEWYDFTAPGTDLLYQPTNALPAVYPGELTVHLFSQDFEFQTRGLSWLLPALSALEEYADNTADVSKIISLLGEMSYAVILDKDYQPDEAYEKTVQDGETTYERLRRFIETGDRALGVLPPGANIKEYPQPPAMQTGLAEILKWHESRLARGVGVSQHTISGSQSDANLSSIRAGEAQNQMVYGRSQHLVTLAMHRVGQLFWAHHTLADRQFRREVPYFEPEIIPPGNSGIDYRDRQVDLAEFEKGLMPAGAIYRRRGLNPAEVFDELAEEARFRAANPLPGQSGAESEPVADPEENPDAAG